jgi:hypothetical protein
MVIPQSWDMKKIFDFAQETGNRAGRWPGPNIEKSLGLAAARLRADQPAPPGES